MDVGQDGLLSRTNEGHAGGLSGEDGGKSRTNEIILDNQEVPNEEVAVDTIRKWDD
jgi:hypothetical protein